MTALSCGEARDRFEAYGAETLAPEERRATQRAIPYTAAITAPVRDADSITFSMVS